MSFKYKVEESKLSEVKVFTPDPHTDYRGTMWTHWDVPPGFINGHLCLSEECIFHYTQSYPNRYVDWQDQISVKWNDPMLKVEWPIHNPILYGRDK